MVATALCALCVVPLLYGSVRWHKELYKHGRRVARGMSEEMDFSPVDTKRVELCCITFSAVLIVVAIGCLVGACFCA